MRTKLPDQETQTATDTASDNKGRLYQSRANLETATQQALTEPTALLQHSSLYTRLQPANNETHSQQQLAAASSSTLVNDLVTLQRRQTPTTTTTATTTNRKLQTPPTGTMIATGTTTSSLLTTTSYIHKLCMPPTERPVSRRSQAPTVN